MNVWWFRNDWMNLLGICRNAILIQQTSIFRMCRSSGAFCLSLLLYISLLFTLCVYMFDATVGKWPHSSCFIYFFINFFPAFFILCITIWLIVMCRGLSLSFFLMLSMGALCDHRFGIYSVGSSTDNWILNSDTIWPKRWFIKQ